MLDERKQCFICGKGYTGLDVHHCLGGVNRKNSDEDGLTVYLCRPCHMKLHDKGLYRRELEIYAQKCFEKHIGTREQFMARYGKNFIKEDVADEQQGKGRKRRKRACKGAETLWLRCKERAAILRRKWRR